VVTSGFEEFDTLFLKFWTILQNKQYKVYWRDNLLENNHIIDIYKTLTSICNTRAQKKGPWRWVWKGWYGLASQGNQSSLQELLQITNYSDWECIDYFLQSGVQKLLAWLGIVPTTLDIDSKSGAFDHLAMATPYAFAKFSGMEDKVLIIIINVTKHSLQNKYYISQHEKVEGFFICTCIDSAMSFTCTSFSQKQLSHQHFHQKSNGNLN